MSNPVPRLRRLLSVIPLIQRRQGISLTELQETLGVSKKELQTDLNAILLCGTPPYHPHDYISVHVEGDRVMVDFADHFARPARLTLPEALVAVPDLEARERSDPADREQVRHALTCRKQDETQFQRGRARQSAQQCVSGRVNDYP